MIKVLIQVGRGHTGRRIYNEHTLEYLHTGPGRHPYPYPYGFIPGTRTDDDACVDCYIITHKPLKAGSIIECEPMGLLEQHEGDEIDHKILAVLPGEHVELDQEVVETLRNFIYTIFSSAPVSYIKIGELLPREQALQHIKEHLET